MRKHRLKLRSMKAQCLVYFLVCLGVATDWIQRSLLICEASASPNTIDFDLDDPSSTEDETADIPVSSSSELKRYVPPGSEFDNDKSSHDNNEKEDVIVLVTVEGDITGISRATGDLLWRTNGTSSEKKNNNNNHRMSAKQKEKEDILFSPLVSTTTNQDSETWRMTAVPSIDGRVYHANHESSLPDLVSRTPFVDKNGRFYVGSTQSSIAVLDKRTGEVLRIISSIDDSKDSSLLRSVTEMHDPEKVIYVGRVDYGVSVYDVATGEVEVSFSNSVILSLSELIQQGITPTSTAAATAAEDITSFGSSSSSSSPSKLYPPSMDYEQLTQTDMDPNTATDSNNESSNNPTTPVILSSPNGNVGLYNPMSSTEEESIEWVTSTKFSSPVAFAIGARSGTSMKIHILPDSSPQSSSSTQPTSLKQQMKHHLDTYHRETQFFLNNNNNNNNPMDMEGSGTIIRSLDNGDLYALPVGPVLPVKAWSHSRYGSSRPPPPFYKKHGHYIDSKYNGRYGYGGGHAIGGNTYNKLLPNPDSNSNIMINMNNNDNNNINNNDPPQDFSNVIYLDPTDIFNIPNEFQQRPFIVVPPPKAKQKWFHTLFKVMTSWIPPAVALAFVISFELGRRERLKKENIHVYNDSPFHRQSKLSSTHSASSLDPNDMSQHNLQQSSSNRNTMIENMTKDGNFGAIQVSDDILGYGGHGTVVYRGTLASRSVAVKRMLQTYHASADREISLLISSDGHPNVVRYFLKEARGDFVYLALELCDLSLHDLIVELRTSKKILAASSSSSSLSNNSTTMERLTKREKAMQNMLKQIAEGVRHIHGLRIVHRDLKPQNILLKRKCLNHHHEQDIVDINNNSINKSCDIAEAFERGEFVPKISDMGLGKQLAGQSSFGISTLGNGSVMRGGGASLGGGAGAGGGVHSASEKMVAGPGSVGWQAPEVMSLRLFTPPIPGEQPDSSSLAEASPPLSMASHRTSRSVDIFSLGCVFHSTLLDGSHPFGEWYEREANIMKNQPDISGLQDVSIEAEDLIGSMLYREPRQRPTAYYVCEHAFFWNTTKRLAFLSEFSDRVEAEMLLPAESTTFNVWDLERNAAAVVGLSWDQMLDSDLISNTSKFRTYDPSSVRDCLRIIRNKSHHYDELPTEVKERIGPTSEGLMCYFDQKFPKLLMHCYNVCRGNMDSTDVFAKKFNIPVRAKILKPECERTSDTPAKPTKTIDSDLTPSTEMEITHHLDASQSGHSDSMLGDVSSTEGTQDLIMTASSDIPTTTTSTSESQSNEIQSSLTPLTTPILSPPTPTPASINMSSVIIWQNSENAKSLQCRGWMRSTSFWVHEPSSLITKRNPNITRCADDPKFRTRLCNHWDVSQGTHCPMRRKNKCVFAHGPVELRVKEGKRNRSVLSLFTCF